MAFFRPGAESFRTRVTAHGFLVRPHQLGDLAVADLGFLLLDQPCDLLPLMFGDLTDRITPPVLDDGAG